MRQAPLGVTMVLLASGVARAERGALSLSLAEQRLGEPPAPAGGGNDENTELDAALGLSAHRFGEKGSWWWGFGGMGTIASGATDARADLTFRTFLGDDFEFNVSLSGWGFFQDGQDAAGLNPGFAFRWHFINDHDKGYSIYAETGIGLLFASDEVPDDGTRFNFTPHAGVGATIELGDGPARLDIGAGWHHISNASTSGSDDNPARDALAVWVGVMFPF